MTRGGGGWAQDALVHKQWGRRLVLCHVLDPPHPCPCPPPCAAKYTVSVTFRICFTFGLLTVIYDWWVRVR